MTKKAAAKAPLILIFGLLLIFLLGYQNCSTSTQPLSESKNQSSSIEKFPYYATFDTLAYSSCSFDVEQTNTLDSNLHFSLKLGSFTESTGLALTDEFLTSVKGLKSKAIVAKITKNTHAIDTAPVLAVRSRRDLYNTLFKTNGASISAGADYNTFLFPLGESAVSGALADLPTGSKLRYLRSTNDPSLPYGSGGTYLQSSLVRAGGESNTAALRTYLQNEGLLTVTYASSLANPADTVLPRNPDMATTGSRAYGNGYLLQFGEPNAQRFGAFSNDPNNQNPRRLPTDRMKVLTSVNEVDLMNTNIGKKAWNCSADYQLKIVRYEDSTNEGGNSNCQRVADMPGVQGYASDAWYKTVRRVLKQEHWWVNPSMRCAVPKSSLIDQCYNRNIQAKKVEAFLPIAYGMNQRCTTATNSVGETDGFFPQCAHFVSICVNK